VKRFLSFIDNSEEILAGSFLMFMCILLLLQVILRYIFGKSLAWSEEMSRYAFLWMVYIGTSLAAKYDGHIRVTAQLNLLPIAARRYVLTLGDLVWLAFNFYVIVQGFLLLGSMEQHPMRSATLGWDMRWIFIVLPIGFVAQTIRILQVIYRRLRGQWRGEFGIEENL